MKVHFYNHSRLLNFYLRLFPTFFSPSRNTCSVNDKFYIGYESSFKQGQSIKKIFFLLLSPKYSINFYIFEFKFKILCHGVASFVGRIRNKFETTLLLERFVRFLFANSRLIGLGTSNENLLVLFYHGSLLFKGLRSRFSLQYWSPYSKLGYWFSFKPEPKGNNSMTRLVAINALKRWKKVQRKTSFFARHVGSLSCLHAALLTTFVHSGHFYTKD